MKRLIPLALLITPLLAVAGGWSVVTLKQLPDPVVVDQPIQVEFTVRAHGRTLVGTQMTVIARHRETGRRVRVQARQAKRGHYAAELTLPTAGTWQWTVDGYGEHPMPDLEVVEVVEPSAASALAVTGAQLYVAKGCVRCHENRRIDHDGLLVAVGPDLSDYGSGGDFLRQWLQDPQRIRPGTEMPRLELEEPEIEALIAFLTGESAVAATGGSR